MSFAPSPSGHQGDGNRCPLRHRTARRAAVAARDRKPWQGMIVRRGGRPGTSAARRVREDEGGCKYQRKYKRDGLRRLLGTAPSRDEIIGISSKIPRRACAGARRKARAIKPRTSKLRCRRGHTGGRARPPAGFASVRRGPGSAIIERGRGRPGGSRGPAARIVNPSSLLLSGELRRPRKPGWSPAGAGRRPTSAIVNPCRPLLIHPLRSRSEPVRSGHSGPAGMDRAGHGRHHRG
jgi:hypothetical protein